MYIKDEALYQAGRLLLITAIGTAIIYPEAWKYASIGTWVGILMMLASVRVR
jgi:hypothetical protein